MCILLRTDTFSSEHLTFKDHFGTPSHADPMEPFILVIIRTLVRTYFGPLGINVIPQS